MSNTETSGILLIGDSGAAVFGAAPTGRPRFRSAATYTTLLKPPEKPVSPSSPW